MEQKREVLAYLQKALEAAGVNASLILSEDGKTVEFTDLAVYGPKHISVAFDSPAAMIVDVIDGAAKWFVR